MRDKEGHDDIVQPAVGNENNNVTFTFEKSDDIAVGRKKITFRIQATAANNVDSGLLRSNIIRVLKKPSNH